MKFSQRVAQLALRYFDSGSRASAIVWIVADCLTGAARQAAADSAMLWVVRNERGMV